MMANWPTLSDINSARQAIDGIAIQTPVIRSALGGDQPYWLKLETLQPSGAFKLRGAANAISRLNDVQKERGVVCCSTGNHGTAVAYAAKRMNVPATVCLSELVPQVKADAIAAFGGCVLREGQSQDDAQRAANRLMAQKGVTDIPPFDHFDVIAGQGTIGLELLEQQPDLKCIIVPLSGGGLMAGVALVVKAIKPSIRIIGVSMDRGAAMAASLEAGHPVEVTEVASLADSLGGGIGLGNKLTFEICRELVDEVVLVTEDEIYSGMQALFLQDRLVAEGACAVGHAAILAGKIVLTGPTATVITGRNVDMDQFTRVVTGQTVQLGELEIKGH
ncbi:MAG: hydroxyectoine utilization dehydratase EutB [Paracoccaceae bacterium]